MKAKDRIIFALDVNDREEAYSLVDKLEPYVGCFKIGLEAFISCGRKLIQHLAYVVPVFLDLKIHDIPNTTEKSVKAAADLGIKYFTIFYDSSTKIDFKKIKNIAGDMKIILVVKLTSNCFYDEKDKQIKYCMVGEGVEEICDGVICPGPYLKTVRSVVDDKFLLITPGIRIAEKAFDQKMVTTPTEAIRNGADLIVIGREVRFASNPIEIIKNITDQIESLEGINS